MKVFLAGPIEHWWDGNWHTPHHLRFIEWRDTLSRELVQRGHLVYRPHEAFKGAWDEAAQAVNDRALEIADLVIVSNYDPPVRCEGTDAEIRYVNARRGVLLRRRCRAQLVAAIVTDPPASARDEIGGVSVPVRHFLNGLEREGLLVPPPEHVEREAATWDVTG